MKKAGILSYMNKIFLNIPSKRKQNKMSLISIKTTEKN